MVRDSGVTVEFGLQQVARLSVAQAGKRRLPAAQRDHQRRMRHRIFNDRAAQTVNPFNQIGGDVSSAPLGDDPAVAQGDQVVA